MTYEQLNEWVKRLAPEVHNSIILDSAEEPKQYNYCYIEAYGQHVEYRTTMYTVYVDEALAVRLRALLEQVGEKPYLRIDDATLVEELSKATSYGKESLRSSAKLKLSELMNGGRTVDHHDLRLETEGTRLAAKQPRFVVGAESRLDADPDGSEKQVAHFAILEPVVTEKRTELIRCAEGEIEGLSHDIIRRHRGNDDERHPRRMLTHLNGEDSEQFDSALTPYLDLIPDRIAEENALEEIYFRIVPCYTFRYRNVVGDKVLTGILIDPEEAAELKLEATNLSGMILGGIGNTAKSITRLFGNLAKSEKFKETEDLLRAARLLVAVTVADGAVTEAEKQHLVESIQGLNALKESERETLVALLAKGNSDFLTDSDFHFYNKANAEATLLRMEELASSDGNVHELERDIIEKLRLNN